MHVLLINASPRPDSHIDRLLRAMQHEASQAGAACEMVRVADLTIHPCTGCMACRSCRHCVRFSDDAQRVLQAIARCNALVVGAPCYWGNMPGHLKLLFDRIVYGLIDEGPHDLPRPLHKDKRAFIISTSTTPWPFNLWLNQTRGTVKAIGRILKWSGFQTIGSLQKGGTRHLSGPDSRELQQCRRAVCRLLRR